MTTESITDQRALEFTSSGLVPVGLAVASELIFSINALSAWRNNPRNGAERFAPRS